MTIQDMVTWLEDRGFEVIKRLLSKSNRYDFLIFKDDILAYGIYDLKLALEAYSVFDYQMAFLNDLISKWNAEARKYNKEEVKNNMFSKSDFPVTAAKNNEGIVQIGASEYPIRIDDITVSTDETMFKATVLDPAAFDYTNYYWATIQNWPKERPYIFGRRNGKTMMLKSMLNSIYGAPLTIEKVIFNPPATIVLWSDGTKTVVKAQGFDKYDPEKGLAMAICKKVMGNKGNYNNEINKWTDQYWEKYDSLQIDNPKSFNETLEKWNKLLKKLGC